MNVLQVKAACAAPYGSPLLKGIEFTLPAGTAMGLIGPNGSGKSTLLHTLAGGLPLTGGSLELCGKPLEAFSNQEKARCLALQSQQGTLNFPFSVEEVVLLGRIPHASGRSADEQIVEEVLTATDTASLRNRPYTQLSGGEKQRVQLARAVAQVWREEDAQGRLLMLDEPSSALDLAHQKMVLELVAHLTGQSCSVIISSHDFNLLASRVDYLLVLDGGSQHSWGTPADVLTADMFATVFDVDVQVQQNPANNAPLVIQI